MDVARDDVIIARPLETDPRKFGVQLQYFDATFVIVVCILILIALVIYVAHRYQRTRVRAGVPTIIIHDSSDVPQNAEECRICLCIFIVGDQLASH